MIEFILAEPKVPYLGIIVLLAMALGIALGAILVGWFLRPRRASDAKSDPYECGMVPVGDAWDAIPVRYYTTAMLFLLFDVEAFFLWPWAVALKGEGFFFVAEAFVFIAIVGFGYAYAWRRGAFEWTRA